MPSHKVVKKAGLLDLNDNAGYCLRSVICRRQNHGNHNFWYTKIYKAFERCWHHRSTGRSSCWNPKVNALWSNGYNAGNKKGFFRTERRSSKDTWWNSTNEVDAGRCFWWCCCRAAEVVSKSVAPRFMTFTGRIPCIPSIPVQQTFQGDRQAAKGACNGLCWPQNWPGVPSGEKK